MTLEASRCGLCTRAVRNQDRLWRGRDRRQLTHQRKVA